MFGIDSFRSFANAAKKYLCVYICINSDYFYIVRIQAIFFYIENFKLSYDKIVIMENKFTDQIYGGQVEAVIL